MALLDQINEDVKSAMKEKSEQVLSTLRVLKSALKNKQIELMRELNDEDVITVIQGQVKQLHESLDSAMKAGRTELEAKAKEEMELLKRYLPPELSSEEVDAAVKQVLADMQATSKDMGKVMGVVMQKLKGRVNGQRVREAVEKMLQ